jgi:putative nucleotidyltransferase with HDIG domain
LDYAAKQNFPLDVRIAALFHDIGKPRVKEGEGPDSTFYGHDIVGGKMSAEILERLHFPKDRIEKIVKLVRWHLFKHDDTTTDSYLRRLFRRVGVENMIDLVRVRMCDRVGTGVPKTVPYQLRNFQFRVEKVMKEEEAPTPKMLKVNGEDIMRILKIRPGPKVGRIIEVLMQDVLDEPSKNTRENLELRIKNLGKLTDEELAEIAEDAEKKVEMVEDERISELKAKYYVK